MGITALRAGQATLRVVCHVRAPAPGSEVLRYESETHIRVLEPLQLLSPSALLLPLNSKAQITTTWDDEMSLLHFEVLPSSANPSSQIQLEVEADSGTSSKLKRSTIWDIPLFLLYF